MKQTPLCGNSYILFVMFCLLSATIHAQTQVTVKTAGTLSTLLSGSETSIKVSGPLNGTDFKYLRDQVTNHTLTNIDLTEASVVSGGDAYYEDKVTQDNVMPEYAFTGCTKLTDFTLPSTVTSVGSNAFSRSGLKSAVIPNTVTTLGMDAYAYCGSLTTVVLGKRVAKMNQGVFYSSAVSNAYFKPTTPPTLAGYMFSSKPKIHVYSTVLADYKATDWSTYGTLTGDLENTYPYEKDPDEVAAEKFITYFSDTLCTQLKPQYASLTDESLTQLLTQDSLTTDFISIALKIKNDQWADYEKYFRVHQYKAYSDAAYWNDKLQATGGSYMGNPTGIYVKGTENLIVFVGDDIPEGATLYLAAGLGNDMITSATTGKKLLKGLNIVPGTTNALYYILYTADTRSMTKKLSEWPSLNIHIEGGVVNGYYELSRHSDSDYQAILSAATHERFTVKGDEALFNFKTQSYRDIWPTTVDKSICWFDSVTVWQKELMGFCEQVALGHRDFYPHNVSGGDAIFPLYYNNPNFAVEGEADDAGWANSTSYRTMYNTEACVKASFDMEHTDVVDDWCSGHECGHNNQSAINLEGCGEVSNNLFANMVRFIDGLVTSTGTTVTTTFDDYAAHIPYYLRSTNSRIHMYHQLWLYFHAARRNTAFFPTLFQELRKSPMVQYNSTNNYNGALKFIRLACKVAQQDLSDFFRAWGFFEAGKFDIEDYGEHTVTVKQYDINRVIKEISQYPRNRELVFIEDRVQDVLSTGFPTVAGQKRRNYEVIGQCGDLGQFTDYLSTDNQPSSYTCHQNDSLIHMTGTGGVGFEVLDTDGNLLYGTNNRSFCLPASVVGQSYTIWSVDADGTLQPANHASGAVQVLSQATAGQLPDTLSSTIAGAKLTGKLNGTDMKRLRSAVTDDDLIWLDLTGVSIRAGGQAYSGTLKTAYNIFPENMFYNCKNLQYITLPTAITKVSKQALGKTGLKSIVIPNLVTTIDVDACAYCDNLSQAVIGDKVKTMNQGTFYESPLTDVYVKPLTPPTLSIYNFNSSPTIHVHQASLAKYQASAWASYGTIVGDLDDWEAEQATRITTPSAQQTPDTASPHIYNLCGQRMSSMHKGINIVAGRKVLK